MMHPGIRTQLVEAAHVVAAAGLSDAFGHLAVRADDSLLITGARPLAFQGTDDIVTLPLDSTELPLGAPKEAWIHLGIAHADASSTAFCRAQPRAVARATAAARRIRPLDGHGALLGSEVPVYDDSRLVRDAHSGAFLAQSMGAAPALVLRGNGAVTRGEDLAAAVARMWLLSRSAELALEATPDAPSLPEAEQEWWRERDAELLPRIFDFLVRTHGRDTL